MKLISINIEANRHYEKFFPFIKNELPDVVCFQEILEEDLPLFKAELGMDFVFKPRIRLSRQYFPDLGGSIEGVAIFAKNIMSSGYVYYRGNEETVRQPPETYFLDEENNWKNFPLLYIETKDKNGEVYKIMTTHLPVTHKAEVTPFQLETVDLLLEKLEKNGDFVLCGDMNAPRGKEAFDRIASKYKDNIPAEYQTSIDQNLHKVKGLQYMVDGLFSTQKYKAQNVKLVDGMSDHMAIVAEICANQTT